MYFPRHVNISKKIIPLLLTMGAAGTSNAYAAAIELGANEVWIGIIGSSLLIAVLAAMGIWYFRVFRKRIPKEKRKERLPLSVLGQLNMGGRLKVSVIEVGEAWLVVGSDGQSLQSLAQLSTGGRPLVTSQFILPTEHALTPKTVSLPPAAPAASMAPTDWAYQAAIQRAAESHVKAAQSMSAHFSETVQAQKTSLSESFYSEEMAGQGYSGHDSNKEDHLSGHLVDYSDPGFPDLIEAISSISPRHAHVATMPASVSVDSPKAAKESDAGRDFRSMYKSNLETAGSNNEA